MADRSSIAKRGLRPASELAIGRPHGDRIRYMAGCRCAECRGANTAYEKARVAARKAGNWNGLVSAERARQHILQLSAQGVGRDQVADAAGVSVNAIDLVRTGERLRIRALTERALLAVTTEAAADRALIDAAPTWKLLNDLLASGYTKAHLARELGFETPRLQIPETQCTVRTAHQVQQLHGRLRRMPAREIVRLIAELREEGYRPGQIEAMARDLAGRRHQPAPDLQVYGDFISVAAAELVRLLHQELTEVPA